MAASVMRAMTFGLSDGSSISSSSKERESRSESRSSRKSGRNGSEGRSNSHNRGLSLARTISRGEWDEEEQTVGLTLSRTSSLVPVGPGILLNAKRDRSPLPSPSVSPPTYGRTTSDLYTSATTALNTSTNLDLSRTVSAPSASASSPPPSTSFRPSFPRTSSDTSSTGPHTPLNPSFPVTAGESAADLAKRGSTIRFAPLPEIRPRAYSTGRNVWLEDDPDFDPEAEGFEIGEDGIILDGEGVPVERRRHLVRRGDEQDDYPLDDDDEEDEGTEGRDKGSKWGSWSEVWGLSPGSKRQVDEDAVSMSSVSPSVNGGHGFGGNGLERTTSTTSSLGGGAGSMGGGSQGSGSSKKLLKAFGFGKSKSSKKDRPVSISFPSSSSVPTSSSAFADLSRTSSIDSSHASSSFAPSTNANNRDLILTRTLSIDTSNAAHPRPKGSTGIPMRKAATWEPGDVIAPAPQRSKTGAPVYYASPARTARKRANYPPVAQRSRNAPMPPPSASARNRTEVEEPVFDEWGGAAGGGGVGSVPTAGVRGRSEARAAEEDDDGSGLAWLRKRRAEREAAAKKAKEEEAQAAAAASTSSGRSASPALASPVDDPDFAAPPSPTVLSSSLPDAGIRLPLPPVAVTPAAPSQPSLRTLDSFRAPPKRSGTLDSTMSTASDATIRPAMPASVPSSAASTRPSSPARPLKSGLAASRPVLSVDVNAAAAGTHQEEEQPLSAVSALSMDDDEEEEEDDDDEGSSSDDDDLDEEELAREEALAEEAKRGAKAMGAERYHSATHENRLLQVSKDAENGGGGRASPKLA